MKPNKPLDESDGILAPPRPELELAMVKDALTRLQMMAMNGNFQAAESIVEVGNHAADMLNYILSCCHPLMRDHQTVSIVAEHSERWPVSIPAITEIRTAAISETLPENLGDALAVRPRPKGRKGRSLTNPGETRLALDVHNMLEARRMNRRRFTFGEPWESMATKLQPLTPDTLPSWVSAGLVLTASDYERNGSKLLRTRELINAVRRCQTRDTLSFKSAFTKTCNQWLKTGFRQLVQV